ncbi:MAG: chemotaxis protein CheX [Firmicutes bacterium]|nr:chemotaxis protein CheX [Bacillota bacterium]
MKVEIINPFAAAAFTVIEKSGNTQVTRGTLSLGSSPVNGDMVNVVIGVTGDVSGQVIYCMSNETALSISSLMLAGFPVMDFDEMAKSAISELGNIITGNATLGLSKNGYACHITPPSLIVGEGVQISIKDLQIIIIPLLTPLGKITIYVALKETPPA